MCNQVAAGAIDLHLTAQQPLSLSMTAVAETDTEAVCETPTEVLIREGKRNWTRESTVEVTQMFQHLIDDKDSGIDIIRAIL